jgi:hypothetical protein
MASNRYAITATTLPFGRCEVFYGALTPAGSMLPLGLVEGDVVAAITHKINTLTYPEHTGDAPIREDVQTDGVTVTLPILITDAALMAKLSPTGAVDFGGDNFKPTVPKTLLIISQSEVDPTTGIAYSGTVWTPAAPKNAIWLWKAVPMLDRLVWGFTDNGRRFVEVPFHAQFDPTKPDKLKLACFGDPAAQGVTGILI